MFQNKVVIITGASSGIGAGTAEAFAKEGAKLVLGGRNEENLKKTAKSCEEQGSKPEEVMTVIGDLTKEECCNDIVDKAVEQFGQIDVLVNNAGITKAGNLEQTTVNDVDLLFNTLVRSVFILTKRAMPHLKKTKGSVINISSSSSKMFAPSVLAYGMAKAALNHFTKSVAQDVGASGVRVNAIIPGVIDTPIFSRPGGYIEGHPEKMAEFLGGLNGLHALNRCGNVEECAHAILFLASDAASFITGALLPVDGGLTSKPPLP